MSSKSIIFVLAGLFLAAGAAVAQPAEWVVQAPMPELRVGNHVEGNGNAIEERIPPGETVDAWTRMVTTQRFGGVIAGGLTLEAFHERFLGNLAGGCPGYRGGQPRYFDADGHRAIEFRVDCPLNPATRQPEVFFLRGISGARDLHVFQVAFRHMPGAAETAWAQSHLASASVCSAASRNPACRAGH